MSDFIQEIKDRRLLPAVGVYAGSCWVLIEIVDRLVERYLLSPYLTDIAFWGLYSLIPAVLLVAWTHGKPGKDKATTVEKVGIPINIIATLGLLITAFGGKDLSAAADLVTVSNEEGVQESHYVPSDSYRRRLAVFFFENESSDPGLDWLQYGVTELLVQDLQQSPFILASSPWANFSNGFYGRMKQAGFPSGLGVPRSLMREIASDANRQYFLEGSVTRISDEYKVTARIWETQSLQKTAELSLTGWDLYSTIDKLTAGIYEALDVPQNSQRIAEDLPLAETYGESQEAFRSYIEGLNSRLFDNDFAASNAKFEQAVAADPGFVLAWFAKALNDVESGDLPSAQAAIQRAQELDYRLPARDRSTLKYIKYRLDGQNEKMIAFLRMQVELNDDAKSYANLAVMLMVTGQLEEAKEKFTGALQRDPLSLDTYLQLASLERATGNPDAAIGYARRYQAEKPESMQAHIMLGDLLRDSGELDAAQQHYEQATLLENQPVVPLLRMATIAARKGNAKAARGLVEQAEAAADTAFNKALVRQAAAFLEGRLGRLRAAIDQIYQLEDLYRQFQSPFVVALGTYLPLVQLYIQLGDVDKAESALDTAATMVEPPMDQFLAFAQAGILLYRGDLAGVAEAVQRGSAIIEQFKLEDLKFQVDLTNGYLARKAGNPAASADSFQAALDRIERSVIGGNDLYLQMPYVQAELAESLTESGQLDRAGEVLDRALKLDPNEPLLWVAKARLQFANGMQQMASASLGYAFAVWNEADADYTELVSARELLAEIRAGQ